jgi:hypothetical protein
MLPSPTLQRNQQVLLIIPWKGESLLINREVERVMDSRGHLSLHIKQGGLPHMPAMNQTLCEYIVVALSTMHDIVWDSVFYHNIHCIRFCVSPTFSARRSKTNISLVPRAVTRGKSESAPGNQQAPSGTGNGEPASVTRMSNDDFRKLLAKK